MSFAFDPVRAPDVDHGTLALAVDGRVVDPLLVLGETDVADLAVLVEQDEDARLVEIEQAGLRRGLILRAPRRDRDPTGERGPVRLAVRGACRARRRR